MFRPTRSDVMCSACESYHLPEHVAAHVDFVTPTVHFDAKLSKRSGGGIGLPTGNGPKTTGQLLDGIDPTQLSNCDSHITPSCLRALYDFEYYPLVPEKNSYGIGEYGNVIQRTLFEVAYSRVYPAIVPSGRSQQVRSELFLGPLWCQPCHGFC